MIHSGDVEALDGCLKEAAQKLGDLLKRQSTLRRELEAAGADAQAKGCLEFATIFRAMAAQVGAGANRPGKLETTCAKRRGRLPKLAADGHGESGQQV
jgi:hypothetical protein